MMEKTKRWIMAMCVISLLGTSLTACGQKKEEEKQPEPTAAVQTETPTPAPEENLGKLITKANDENTLIEKYGSIGCRVKTHMEDGSIVSGYVYRSEDYFYSEQGGTFQVDDGGDVYGYEETTEPPEYRCLFVDDAYKEFSADDQITDWTKDCEEEAELSGEADEDGLLAVSFLRDMTDEEKQEFEASGFTDLEESRLRFLYKVDEISYEIASEEVYLSGKDKKSTLLTEMTLLYDEKKPKMEQEYLDRVFSEDFRKVQVVVDPGSPKEQTYTQTVGKGCSVLIAIPSSYDPKIYQNAACTEEWNSDSSDLDSDVVVYVLSTEGGHGSTATPAESSGESTPTAAPGVTAAAEETKETAQCPTCGKRFSVDESSGTSAYQQHMDLEQRLATAQDHLDDQIPLELVDDEQYAEQCPWCGNWYSTESQDGVTSDYVDHTQWESEYETVYNSLKQ